MHADGNGKAVEGCWPRTWQP